MTSRQSTVIWLGLVLVALNLVIHAADIKSVIFGTSATSKANAPAGNPVLPAQPSPSPNSTPPNIVAPGINPNDGTPTVV